LLLACATRNTSSNGPALATAPNPNASGAGAPAASACASGALLQCAEELAGAPNASPRAWAAIAIAWARSGDFDRALRIEPEALGIATGNEQSALLVVADEGLARGVPSDALSNRVDAVVSRLTQLEYSERRAFALFQAEIALVYLGRVDAWERIPRGTWSNQWSTVAALREAGGVKTPAWNLYLAATGKLRARRPEDAAALALQAEQTRNPNELVPDDDAIDNVLIEARALESLRERCKDETRCFSLRLRLGLSQASRGEKSAATQTLGEVLKLAKSPGQRGEAAVLALEVGQDAQAEQLARGAGPYATFAYGQLACRSTAERSARGRAWLSSARAPGMQRPDTSAVLTLAKRCLEHGARRHAKQLADSVKNEVLAAGYRDGERSGDDFLALFEITARLGDPFAVELARSATAKNSATTASLVQLASARARAGDFATALAAVELLSGQNRVAALAELGRVQRAAKHTLSPTELKQLRRIVGP